MHKQETTNRKYIIRRIILTLIILGFAVFCFTQHNCFRDEKKVPFIQPTNDTENKEISVTGTHEIRQSFIAEQDHIGKIRIFFTNPGSFNTSGNVKLTLEDADGNTVSDTTLKAKYIRPTGATEFYLGGSSDAPNANGIVETFQRDYAERVTAVEKGEPYVLVLSLDNIKSNHDVTMEYRKYNNASDVTDGTVLSADGKEIRMSCIKGALIYRKYSARMIMTFAVLLLTALAFVLFPVERLDERLHRKGLISRIITTTMFWLTPFVTYMIIETYLGKTGRETMDLLLSFKGLLNMIVIGFVWWVIYTLSNRVRFTAAATSIIGSAFGLANYMLIAFRASPFIATDIPQIKTALEVAGTYVLTWNRASLWSLMFTVAWVCTVLAVDGHPGLPLKRRLLPLAGMIAWAGIFYYSIFVYDTGIRISGFKARTAYEAHGSALSFAYTVKNSFIRKPSGYTVDEVEKITGSYTSDSAVTAVKATKATPNIIIVMNESFTDFAALGEMKTNVDYMPFYHSLSEDTIKGWMDSSVFGGATADTEFECLTSFSMRFLPLNSIPYNSHIKGEMPSLTRSLKAMGYGGNIAFHPGMRDSYNRENIYPLLGFDKHIAVEDLPENAEKIRAYTSDSYDYKVVEKEYEKLRSDGSKAPFFMFNVTIQNHGGYQLSKGLVDSGVDILEADKKKEDAVQFVNLMKESDKALEELIKYFSDVEEPTVVILFGDHQPKVDLGFYSSFNSQNAGLSAIEAGSKRYLTPFMMWCNYDIKEESGIELSANYIAPYILDKLGAPLTAYDKYLLDLRKSLPVITANCYKDSEGVVYDPEESSKWDDKLNEYAILQYNGLVDLKHRQEDFFRLK